MRTHSLPACCGSVYTPIISRWWKNVTGHHCGKPRRSGPAEKLIVIDRRLVTPIYPLESKTISWA
jgi:hypothetical protein